MSAHRIFTADIDMKLRVERDKVIVINLPFIHHPFLSDPLHGFDQQIKKDSNEAHGPTTATSKKNSQYINTQKTPYQNMTFALCGHLHERTFIRKVEILSR